MKPSKLYSELASLIQARLNCIENGSDEWFKNHTAKILELVSENLPSGSGIDRGTEIDLDASTPEKLVLLLSFHHMNESGMYDGWTEHKAIVTPSLSHGFNLHITGRDRNQIKEYLQECYAMDLDKEV